MSILEQIPIKSGSVYAAALEQRGATLQARMLEVINGDDGQLFAGMLFAIAIAMAVGVIAIGGRYIWARYLLVGPALFMFLTQVTVPFSGTVWQFGDAEFPEGHKQKLLRSLETGEGEGPQVSMFFQFWNIFMAELNSTMLTNLNLTENDSHINLISKVQTYMHFTNFNFIKDHNLREFIRMALVQECAAWYKLSLHAGNPTVDLAEQNYYAPLADKAGDKKVFSMASTYNGEEDQNQLGGWLEAKGFDPKSTYSCKEVWDAVVDIGREVLREDIIKELKRQTPPTGKESATFNAFVKKLFTETTRAAQMVRIQDANAGGDVGANVDTLLADPAFDQGFRRAIDWVLAQSLFKEIWHRDRFADNYNLDRNIFHGNRATGLGADPENVDVYATSSNAIEQFNRPEQYQFKGDFVNAALAMPHFQGVMLMLLSASFPLFALAVILPGRSGAIFSWMGLWAWAKMWDIGFGVVMMIDNILYALFPRGPSLGEEDLKNPGIAWQRVMEIDPNYASATYYNLIATCLFAVPLVTAVFVKGAGNELVNASHSRWQAMSSRLAGSAATFKHSLQAQGYSGRMELAKTEAGMQAMEDTANSDRFQQLNNRKATMEAIESLADSGAAAKALKLAEGVLGKGAKARLRGLKAYAATESDRLGNEMNAMLDEARVSAEYGVTNSQFGYFSSESAVASRFFSHDFSSDHPYKQQMSLWTTQNTYDREKFVGALAGDQAKQGAQRAGAQTTKTK